MIFNNRKYEIIRGSDIVRDGMYLELRCLDKTSLLQVAEIFYSDVTSEFTLTCFIDDISLSLIEELIKRKNELLPK